MASIFVGEGRKALVKGIVDSIDNLTDFRGHSRACLISLEAPSGWGKTRVIQEVYKHIAERQSSPYWPHSIIPESEDDPVSRRKHLVPSFDGVARDRNILPEFFWWGLSCDMRSSNMLSRTLMEDIEQLRFHAPYLEASWAASKLTRLGKYATIAKAKSALGAIFEEGTTTGLAKLAELGLGATPFGIGLGLKLVTGGIKAAKDRKEELSLMELGSEAHEAADENIIDETVNLFARLTHKDLPIIICVEDIHKATSPVLELLVKLVARNAPILILTTTWPGEFEKTTQLNALLETSWGQDRILRMIYDQAAPKGLPEEASLAQLPSEDLSAIIRARYPKAEAETITLLARRYKNPLPLELVLSMKSLKLDHPYLELDVEDVEELPETVRDLYNSLWNELPEPVQQLLALSTELMPEGQPEWLMSLIYDVTFQLSDETWAKSLSESAANDNIPHGWARVIEGWLRRFGEADQLKVARKHVRELFGKRQLRQINEALSALLNAFNFENADQGDAEIIHKAWLAIALYQSKKVTLNTYLSAGVYLLENMAEVPLEWPKAIELGHSLLTTCEKLDTLNLDTRILISNVNVNMASVYGGTGKTRIAVDLLKKALKEKNGLLGSDHEGVLVARHNLAYWLAESGALSQALEQHQVLLEDMTRVLGADHQNVLINRHSIVFLLGNLGAADAALEASQTLLKDCTRILGADNLSLLNIRSNIASLLAETGAIFESLEAFRILLEDISRVLGQDHPKTLITRRNYASWLGATGSKTEAMMALQALLQDQIRILGREHPDVLVTRHNIIGILSLDDIKKNNFEIYHALLKEQSRILGLDHPDSLRTRFNFACHLGQSGLVSEALEAFRSLLEDMINILGIDHPLVYKTRQEIACYTDDTTLRELLFYQELLVKEKLTLDPDDEDMLVTRNNIARCLAQNGEICRALEYYADLLEDQKRILLPDDPDKWMTRACIAALLQENNNPKKALEIYKSLLSDIPKYISSHRVDEIREKIKTLNKI